MDLLQVQAGKIVDGDGNPVRLRGVGVGGWMNMENFINGYPGTEENLRRTMADVIGKEKAYHFFNEMLDHFFSEEDIVFIKDSGANVVRLALNYRHFESDDKPFEYRSEGFERLEKVIDWCEKHKIYAILDMHSVQGAQNTDWHSDNPTRHGLFWKHPHFQVRFIELWKKIAIRFSDKPCVAGFNVMNEPVTPADRGRYSSEHPEPVFERLNSIYRRVVEAIREVNQNHIIFLEGDLFSNRFEGLDEPFAENLVYSIHNYIPPTFHPGEYPGVFMNSKWNREAVVKDIVESEGFKFARKHGVPLWVGEFGADLNGPEEERPHRIKALKDQIDVFEELGIHWTLWCYKDVGVMGWTRVKPDSEYMKAIKPLREAKEKLSADFWEDWKKPTMARDLIRLLTRHIDEVLCEYTDIRANEMFMRQAALSNYVGGLLQPLYAECFKDMDKDDISKVMESFDLGNCNINENITGCFGKHVQKPVVQQESIDIKKSIRDEEI